MNSIGQPREPIELCQSHEPDSSSAGQQQQQQQRDRAPASESAAARKQEGEEVQEEQQEPAAGGRSPEGAQAAPPANSRAHDDQQQQQRRRSLRLRDKVRCHHRAASLDHHQSSQLHHQIAASARRAKRMLSKMKASSVNSNSGAQAAGRQRQSTATSDAEDANSELENDTNNNTTQNMNNNNNNNQPAAAASKKTQNQLIDIVEVSRKRRLSKDSADSLAKFIKWSFGHSDSFGAKQQLENNNNHNSISNQNIKSLLEQHADEQPGDDHGDEDDDDEERRLEMDERQMEEDEDGNEEEREHDDDADADGTSPRWPRSLVGREQQALRAEHLLRAARLSAGSANCGGSSAANLGAILRAERDQAGAEMLQTRLGKRARMRLQSPESKLFTTSVANGRKSSNYLGNVVDRLHQQQKQQQQQQQLQAAAERQIVASTTDNDERASDSGLSFHLQQFLQQQTSLEDLCSSVGLDESNQLVLAAAIHRALVDSVGGSSQSAIDTKSTASSTASSSGISSSGGGGGGAVSGPGASQSAGAQANRYQRRTYNTRANLHGLAIAAGQQQQQQQQQSSTRQQNATVAAMAALNMSNRVQQQRHAQAAAALSALASAGVATHQSNETNNHHQHHSHHHHQQFASSGTSAAAAAAANTTSIGTIPGPMVDFECDTCGSSFDDRHRLMQHQSIHLELKKDWFTEIPVDEVMKIFNRRRGEFLCNICNLRFEATFDYDKHNHSVHGQRPYCCQFCGNGTRTFRFWRQYLNHLYDHRYIFSCTIDDCDFTVNRRDSLRFHIFRFHLNCQLPQQQQTIRSAPNLQLGHLGLANGPSKWTSNSLDLDDEENDNELSLAD